MSFKCPGNITHDDNVYNNIKGKCSDVKMNSVAYKFINEIDETGGFLKTGVLPINLNTLSDPDGDTIQGIIRGMLCKIAACNTAYETKEKLTIIEMVKSWIGSSAAISILYVISYIIVGYIGFNYFTKVIFNKNLTNVLFESLTDSISKSIVTNIFKFLLLLVTGGMIGLMLTNKLSIGIEAFAVLLCFSIGVLTMILNFKYVASSNWIYFFVVFCVPILLSIFLPYGLYKRDENKFVNDKKWKKITLSVVSCVTFVLVFITKYIRYSNIAAAGSSKLGTAIIIAIRIAIATLFLTLGMYYLCKTIRESKLASEKPIGTSQSPYFEDKKSINGLIVVYQIIFAIIAVLLLIGILSRVWMFTKIGSVNSGPNIAQKIQAIQNAMKTPDNINNIMYGFVFMIIIALLLALNGVMAIFVPFLLIPLSLGEKLISSAFDGLISSKNKLKPSDNFSNWMPFGSYITMFIIRGLNDPIPFMSNYQSLVSSQNTNITENTKESLKDTISVMNSVIFHTGPVKEN